MKLNLKKKIFSILLSGFLLLFSFKVFALLIKDVLVMDNIEDLRHSIALVTLKKGEYISITDFAYIFDGYLEKGDYFTKAIFKEKNIEITFNHGSKEAFINGEKINLKIPTYILKRKLYIPFSFLKERWGDYLKVNIKWDQKKAILTIDFKKKKEEKKKKAEFKKIKLSRKKEVLPSKLSKKEPPKYRIKRITIDPGHGGKDPGAIGKMGVREKDITLDIAKRIKRLIEKNSDVKVNLTRYFDEFVSLKRRSDIANINKSDLFISIHVNASFSKRAGGFETYYLSAVASDDMARAVALIENGVIELEDDYDSKDYGYTEFILADMAQQQFIEESIELAGILQEIVSKRLKIKSRGIRSALFYVLKDVTMPAILVEVAFISNPREEMKIKRDSFKERIAECICEAILEYKKRYEESLGFTR